MLTTLAFNWPKSESELKEVRLADLETLAESENVNIIDGSSVEEASRSSDSMRAARLRVFWSDDDKAKSRCGMAPAASASLAAMERA